MNVLTNRENSVKNIIWSFIYGVALSAIVQLIRKYQKSKEEKTDNRFEKKLARVVLKPKFRFKREEIIKIGRDAIRDFTTGELLINPVVQVDGKSYNKSQNTNIIAVAQNSIYENRILKEFIERLIIIRKASFYLI
jgi:hypothetical protein